MQEKLVFTRHNQVCLFQMVLVLTFSPGQYVHNGASFSALSLLPWPTVSSKSPSPYCNPPQIPSCPHFILLAYCPFKNIPSAPFLSTLFPCPVLNVCLFIGCLVTVEATLGPGYSRGPALSGCNCGIATNTFEHRKSDFMKLTKVLESPLNPPSRNQEQL